MRPVIAVALSVIKEVWRLRLLVVFTFVFLLVFTVGFAFWLHGGNGLANEKLQTFIGYSLRLITSFLSLTTIFIAVITITRDIKNQEIFTITTKPITRGQYLLGKFMGLVVLNLVLLIVSGGAIYSLAQVLRRTEPKTDVERLRIDNIVMVARKGVKPILPDVTEEARKQAREKTQQYAVEQGIRTDTEEYQQLYHETMATLMKTLMMRYTAAGSNRSLTFHFAGLEPIDPDGVVFVRYKQDVSQNPDNLSLYNIWAVGPQDPEAHGGVRFNDQTAIRTVHEFPVPASLVSPQGDFYVTYYNHAANNTSVIFPQEDGVEVLYLAGYFEANLIRALLLIFLRLVFLAVVGLAAGAWVSMPVAILLTLVVYFFSLASNFILEAVNYETLSAQADIIRLVIQLFPNFSKLDPIVLIEKGRLVAWPLLSQGLISMVIIRGGIVALTGYLLFRFRELARVIV